MRTRSKIWLAAVVPCLLGAPAIAQISRTPPGPRMMQAPLPTAADTEAARNWQRRLHKVDDQLRGGEWRKARREADRLIDEMLAAIEIDAGTAATLGLTLTFRALAAAGAGDVVAGRWDWLAAQALQPDLNEVSLDPYGAAGKSLELFRLATGGALSVAAARSIGLPTLDPNSSGPAPNPAPNKISGREPHYPKALRATCAKGSVRIAVTVDAAGQPVHPRWLDASGGSAMALALFDAVRDWRYQPARRAGAPVPADLEIRHEFDPGRCRPRALKP